MAKSNGNTRSSSSSSPRGLESGLSSSYNALTKDIEEKELSSIRNALTRYNEAKTESAKERARFSVNLNINNVQIRIEQAISNLNGNSPSDAQEIERLRNYYDSIERMKIRNN